MRSGSPDVLLPLFFGTHSQSHQFSFQNVRPGRHMIILGATQPYLQETSQPPNIGAPSHVQGLVDLSGDTVQSARLVGNPWATQHNTFRALHVVKAPPPGPRSYRISSGCINADVYQCFYGRKLPRSYRVVQSTVARTLDKSHGHQG